MPKKTTLSILLLLIFMGMITYWGIIKPNQISQEPAQQEVTKNKIITIALVNEDTGTTYNGQSLNIGSLLSKSFATKTSYSVESVSRAIAERGLDNHTYQLMVILPSKFSQDALALESTSPEQAVFQYKIKADKGYLVKQAEQAVLELKSLFNKDLIHIYFLSIIGNLQTAQTQVGDVVTADGKTLANFESQLMAPLTLYSKQFTGLAASPTDLLSSYTTLQKAIFDSNEAFTGIVDVNKGYTSELEQVKSLQEQWQESILQRESHLKEYDEGVSQLTVEDQLSQLTSLNETLVSEHNNSEILANTKTASEDLKADSLALVDQLKQLNTQVDETLSQYDDKILAAVKSSIEQADSASLEKQAETLGAYLKGIEGLLTNQFKQGILMFRGFDDATIETMPIAESDKNYLRQVNAFASWFAASEQLTAPTLSSESHYQQ